VLSSRTNMKKNETGNTIIEFAIVATVFFMMLVGIVAAGNLFYTHNALVEATRRGARYGVLQCRPAQAGCTNSGTTVDRIKKMVVFGTDTPATGATSLISNLTVDDVNVDFSTTPSFGLAVGTVSVSIKDTYKFPFVLPAVTTVITMPPYRTTLSGECAGFIPPDID
jgi:Flp pilus assembly protein TadG